MRRGVIEAVDVFEEGHFDLTPGLPVVAPDPFGLQRLEEAFDGRIVVAIAFLAHRGRQRVLAQKLLVAVRTILGGFNRSSQHPNFGGVDDDGKTKVGTIHSGQIVLARTAPVWQRENLCRFWWGIAAGLSSEEAGVEAGVSAPVGSRWFRSSSGMPPTHLAPSAPQPKSRNLSCSEREEIALQCARRTGVRAIARKLGRSPNTISREIRRNSATRGGDFDYRAITAQRHADRAAQRPKASKLANNPALRDYVQDRLAGLIATPDGAAFDGPVVVWKKRRAVLRPAKSLAARQQ